MSDISTKITQMVTTAVADALEEFEPDPKVTADSPIYGDGSPLDSTALVSLIVDIEQRLREDLSLDVSLTDERALSQKNSPFHDVASMAAYIMQIYQEQIGG